MHNRTAGPIRFVVDMYKIRCCCFFLALVSIVSDQYILLCMLHGAVHAIVRHYHLPRTVVSLPETHQRRTNKTYREYR